MAALAARRLKAEQAVHVEHSVFVTRDGSEGQRFGWEVRRFGGLVVARSAETYADHGGARDAGEAELGRLALA